MSQAKPIWRLTKVADERDSLIVPAPPTGDLGLTISSSEPSWIALRREGIVEFEGLLNGERRIDNPDLVEIYAGRPDLVQLSSPDAETRTLGAVDDIRWIPAQPCTLTRRFTPTASFTTSAQPSKLHCSRLTFWLTRSGTISRSRLPFTA